MYYTVSYVDAEGVAHDFQVWHDATATDAEILEEADNILDSSGEKGYRDLKVKR